MTPEDAKAFVRAMQVATRFSQAFAEVSAIVNVSTGSITRLACVMNQQPHQIVTMQDGKTRVVPR